MPAPTFRNPFGRTIRGGRPGGRVAAGGSLAVGWDQRGPATSRCIGVKRRRRDYDWGRWLATIRGPRARHSWISPPEDRDVDDITPRLLGRRTPRRRRRRRGRAGGRRRGPRRGR